MVRVGCSFVILILFQDLVNFEKQWSCFFSSMEQENHLSILELSEAQAGEVGRSVASAFQHCMMLSRCSIALFWID